MVTVEDSNDSIIDVYNSHKPLARGYEDTFTKAALEGDRRSEKLGRNNRVQAPKVKKAPTRFTFIESVAIQGVTPAEQAEYLYSLIESEVR